jgi:YHS domain-containing protein
MAKDPICGMTVDEKTARSAVRDGVTYYFCADCCRSGKNRSSGPTPIDP